MADLTTDRAAVDAAASRLTGYGHTLPSPWAADVDGCGSSAVAEAARAVNTTVGACEALRSIDDQQLREGVGVRRVAAQLAELLGGSEDRAMRICTDTRDAFRSPARS